MKTIYDNSSTINRTDDRFVLEEDEYGFLYETSGTLVAQELVCSALFFNTPTREDLIRKFGSEQIADRYLTAAIDLDK